jgi:hypothetical protein
VVALAEVEIGLAGDADVVFADRHHRDPRPFDQGVELAAVTSILRLSRDLATA